MINKLFYYLKRIPKYFLYPYWMIFRLMNLTQDNIRQKQDTVHQNYGEDKEVVIKKILSLNKNINFLEIGIGQFANLERMKLIIKNNIHYTGLDFRSVCDSHKKDLTYHKLPLKNIHFIANDVGTYTWNLFQMVENKGQYDVIYLDGHHTFYVDLPVFFLSHLLLKKNGLLLVDDLSWTLNFMKNNMNRSFMDWYFYRNIYNFSEYDNKQQSLNHIGMIVKEILINNYKYKMLNQFQSDDFLVLQKPSNI